MPAYKDSKTGTWFVKFYCKDWTGENKQIKKRGFATKREALDYERNYKIRQENNLDMTFGEFWKLYTEDVKNYVKLNTWLTKEHIVDTKILPYFKNLKMNEITPGDVRKWQNEMVAFRNENGKSYSQTYKKTMHNILSAIFNHACRFYNLKSNPAGQAGAINHFAINCTDIDGAYKLAQEKGYKVVSEGIEALPFWEKGIRFFIIEGPNKERGEIDQIL